MRDILFMGTKVAFGLMLTGLVSLPVQAIADEGTEAIVYAHYRCAALVSMNTMTDDDALVCDELFANTEFDLISWEADHPETSLKLHEDVFYEFF